MNGPGLETFAHSLEGRPVSDWETLRSHAAAVASRCAANADPFGCSALCRVAGYLHDIGKCSPAFQRYLFGETTGAKGPDHSTAGAVEALRLYGRPAGRMLAFIIAGHHAGLADGVALDDRLTKALERYDGWERQIDALPPLTSVAPTQRLHPGPHKGFSKAFLVRMLFSCLVDADFTETERFYAGLDADVVQHDAFSPLTILLQRQTSFMTAMEASAARISINGLRADILKHVISKAELAPGLFTMTVPTGGGKTLASLSFALEHAVRHGLRRVVYVIPFTSIIEQTARVFRRALAETAGRENDADVLEHHATFDWEQAHRSSSDEGRGSDPIDRLRRATENWDAPIVVTTAVQFFESLFANRPSRCRKLHNLARSVIVLDEAQTLPVHLLRPCLAALDELARNYGSSVILCTATQPALRRQDDFELGLDIPAVRELAPDPAGLYTKLKRVEVERLPGLVSDGVIAARFAEQPQMLCIVNTRSHAQALFGRIKDLPGAVHLTTLMCPAHRRRALAEARERLAGGEPVRIVSTSLIEAGVDIDLPEVWRAAAGIDNIAQAAGRCNREGKMSSFGRVVVFDAEDGDKNKPRNLTVSWEVGRTVLRSFPDVLALDAIHAYFRELYWRKGPAELDSAQLDGNRFSVLGVIEEREKAMTFPFKTIAQAFRLIEDIMEPVIVPWKAGPEDHEAETLLARIAAMDRPLKADLRRLQQYVVAIPKRARDEWLRLGVLRPIHPALGDALLRFEELEHYDPATGVRLGETMDRSAESNVM